MKDDGKTQLQLLQVTLARLTPEALLRQCIAWLEAPEPVPHRIYLLRGAILQDAIQNSRLRSLLQEAHLCLAGGRELALASVLTQQSPPEILTTDKWLSLLLQWLAQHNRGVFYIGGHAEATQAWASLMRERYPGLPVEAQDGAFEKWGPENDRVLRAVARFRPALVLVGLGSPYQEEYVHAHASLFKAPLCIAIGPEAEQVTGLWPRGPLRTAAPDLPSVSTLAEPLARVGEALSHDVRQGVSLLQNAGVIWSSWRQKRRKSDEPPANS